MHTPNIIIIIIIVEFLLKPAFHPSYRMASVIEIYCEYLAFEFQLSNAQLGDPVTYHPPPTPHSWFNKNSTLRDVKKSRKKK